MPWSIQERDGKHCVVKEGESSPVKCHDSRSEALAHQRALYANESNAASMSLALNGDSLTPLQIAMVSSMEALHEQIKDDRKLMVQIVAGLQKLAEDAKADREKVSETLTALVAGLTLPEFPEITVNVPPAEVTVNVPEAKVDVTVPTPQVNVRVDAPSTKREVTFERDPLTGSISSAKVEEVS